MNKDLKDLKDIKDFVVENSSPFHNKPTTTTTTTTTITKQDQMRIDNVATVVLGALIARTNPSPEQAVIKAFEYAEAYEKYRKIKFPE